MAKRGGTGFGLAIAKQLVEAHRGQITVSSGGKGTRFTIALRAEAEDADATAFSVATRTQTDLSADRTGSDSRRVLLAEDGRVNQRLISSLLRFAGHTVDVVSNGREALDACASQAFDVVLMDVEMPVMDGREASLRDSRTRTGHRPARRNRRSVRSSFGGKPGGMPCRRDGCGAGQTAPRGRTGRDLAPTAEVPHGAEAHVEQPRP